MTWMPFERAKAISVAVGGPVRLPDRLRREHLRADPQRAGANVGDRRAVGRPVGGEPDRERSGGRCRRARPCRCAARLVGEVRGIGRPGRQRAASSPRQAARHDRPGETTSSVKTRPWPLTRVNAIERLSGERPATSRARRGSAASPPRPAARRRGSATIRPSFFTEPKRTPSSSAFLERSVRIQQRSGRPRRAEDTRRYRGSP